MFQRSPSHTGQQGETKAIGSPLDVEGPGGCSSHARPEPVAGLPPGPVAQEAMPGCPTLPASGGRNWRLLCSFPGPGHDSHVGCSLTQPGSCVGWGLPQGQAPRAMGAPQGWLDPTRSRRRQGGHQGSPSQATGHLPGDRDRPRSGCWPTGSPGLGGPMAMKGRVVESWRPALLRHRWGRG